MKLNILLVLMTSLSLTACGFMSGYGQEGGAGGNPDYFKNARGDNVWGCAGQVLRYDQGLSYLKSNNLPLEIGGNFICVNEKPTLPKDCQGREFRSEAELRVFWEKYQLPVGSVRFDCSTGTPKIRQQGLKFWQDEERLNPTCKDSRGRKRACV